MPDRKKHDSPMEKFEDLGRKIFQVPKEGLEEAESTKEEPECDPSDEPNVEE